MITILVAEDDRALNKLVCTALEGSGYRAVSCPDGLQALAAFEENGADMLVTDIMMPGLDGFGLAERVRESDKKIPILFMTALDDKPAKLRGYALGADDYVVKPFDAKEVVARVKAVLRRSAGAPAADIKQVEYDKLKINLTNYELWVDGKRIDTPPKELELIYHLASNPNRVFTRDQLLDEVWGFDYYGDSRTVDVHVKRLREKLEGVSDKWELKTVWSVGYKFETKD